jgi:hypothetical protein
MSTPALRLPKMMIGFVVRRCAVELGHPPSAAEFAAWANGGAQNVFGRPISEAEARVVLRHRARLVSARSAADDERYVEPTPGFPPSNVIDLAALRARQTARRLRGSDG